MPRPLAIAVLASFSAFSLYITITYGYTGFLALAAREPWALQILLDLAIACSFVVAWMVRDARTRGRTVWPFVVATVFLGSIGPLAYVTLRGRSS